MPSPYSDKVCQAIGERLSSLRTTRSASNVARGKKPETELAYVQLLLGSGATTQDLSLIESGQWTFHDGVIRRWADKLRVPHKWLKAGKAIFEDDDIVRLPGVARRLTEARMSRGLTCCGVSTAAGLGTTSRNVSRVEDLLHYPRYATVKKLALVCGVSTQYVLFG